MRAITESESTPRYWDLIASNNRERLKLDCWREYMKLVYSRLIHAWFPQSKSCFSMKTDLFEEAFTTYSLLPELGTGALGMDHSFEIVRSAKERLLERSRVLNLVVCDLRNLPFRSESIQQILSPSSLDHFKSKKEIVRAIEELSRVLKPGGVLILTLDNPQNPIVWIRNALPFSWLNRIGLVPYYVGPTCTVNEAKQQLQSAGLSVTECTAVAHVPRAPAIWLSMLEQKIGSKMLRLVLNRCFEAWEVLQNLPLRYRTGYYIALRATK